MDMLSLEIIASHSVTHLKSPACTLNCSIPSIGTVESKIKY